MFSLILLFLFRIFWNGWKLPSTTNLSEEQREMSIEGQIAQVEANLNELGSGESSLLNYDQLSALIDRLSIDRASLVANLNSIKALLSSAVKVLYRTDLQVDYNKVIELLDTVLNGLEFEAIIEIFSFDYILEALNSQNENLQILALKVASKANPPDLISNTEIIPKEIEFLANKDTSVRLVNEIEKSLSVLLEGELIRRRVLSDYVLSILQSMKSSSDTTILTRLLDFLTQLLPFVSEGEISKELYSFFDFQNDDILYTLSLVKFDKDVLDIVDFHTNKEWLLNSIVPQLELISKLYHDRASYPDIEYFAVSAIEELLKKISYVSVQLFRSLDSKYIAISKNDLSLLSTLNPAYLGEYHTEVLKALSLNAETVPVYRNLIESEKSFDIIRSQMSSRQLLRLPYIEFMAILVRLSEYRYGREYLLNELPQVMNKLLNGANVIETESYQLRKLTLENLNRLSDEELDVWRNGVRSEYYTLVNGKPLNPEVSVMDVAL